MSVRVPNPVLTMVKVPVTVSGVDPVKKLWNPNMAGVIHGVLAP